MKRGRQTALLLACALAGVLSAVLVAQPSRAAIADHSPPTETTPAVIPAGVRISGIAVGGLTPDAASAVITTAFEAPLTLKIGKRILKPMPASLGATAYVSAAVSKALVAAPDSEVPLGVQVAGKKVRAYVTDLGERFDRRPKDARVVLRKAKPLVTEERLGQKLERTKSVAVIVRQLRLNDRLPMALPLRQVAPRVTRKNVGLVLVIRRESKWLHAFDGAKFVKRFRIATGMPQYPTPLGRFSVVSKWRNPWWYPPDADWARGKEPIPPGPGNPLGTRWMGISSPGVGIHGTPDPASLGYSLSHGCIRMAISDAEWLFKRVQLGTTVFIIRR
ncbi:MAG: L,D-transpeptidase family protein [Gaiellaceae bacterium]